VPVPDVRGQELDGAEGSTLSGPPDELADVDGRARAGDSRRDNEARRTIAGWRVEQGASPILLDLSEDAARRPSHFR